MISAAKLPHGALAALGYMRVITHLHDNGTLWAGNSATISLGDLQRFWYGLAEEGLIDAIAPSPYTNPRDWIRFHPQVNAMRSLAAHTDAVEALGLRMLYTSVEAQIVPVFPGQELSLDYVLDVPPSIAGSIEYVIAAVHAQPLETERLPDHVSAMRYAAVRNPLVHCITHIDRYVSDLPFPNFSFFQTAARFNTAIGINENYLSNQGCLIPGRELRVEGWGSLLEGDVLLTPDEFVRLNGVRPDEYDDYRWSHMLDMMIRAGTPIVVELDWHLPTTPADVRFDNWDLGPTATSRLERFGNFLQLRGVPLDLVVTRSSSVFSSFLTLPRGG